MLAQEPFSYRLGEKEGLPINKVFDIHVSKEGFLFAGTAMALVKYDGKKFESIATGEGRTNITEFQELNQNDLYFISFNGRLFCFQDDSVRLVHQFEEPYPSLNKLSSEKIIFSGQNGFYTYSSNGEKALFKALPVMDTAGKEKKSVLLGRIYNGVVLRCQNELFTVDTLLNVKKIHCTAEQRKLIRTFRSAFFFGKKSYFFWVC